MTKVWVCPVHGAICKEGEEQLIVQHRLKDGCYAYPMKLEHRFTEDEIEELCRP